MNPITNIKNQNRLNEREVSMGIAGDLKKSWHQQYKDSAWIYVGGLPFEISEGDIIAVFSQYGEVMNINLIRDQKTGKSRGFAFLCYQDQRSTVLAVDNLNGITLLKRMLKVDHVEEYKVPKYREDADEETKRLWEEGCAPKPLKRRIPDEAEIQRAENAAEAKKNAIMSLKEDDDVASLRKKIKLDRKLEKKAKKKEEKAAKKLKKLMKKAKRDPDGDWNEKIKLLDVKAKEEDLYGQNEHFDFGKKMEKGEASSRLDRPDFEKADWRELEIWKLIREQEKADKAAKGGKKDNWGPEDHFVSNRHRT